jgi:hypothetical protein
MSPLASGIGLAMLRRQHGSQLIDLGLDELEKLEEHTCSLLRIGRGPGGLRFGGIGNGSFRIGLGGQRDLGLHFTRIGIKHIGRPARPGDMLSTYKMSDLAHIRLSPGMSRNCAALLL